MFKKGGKKMKKTRNKVLAFVMTLVMVLTVIPFSVFAAGKSDISIATVSDSHYYANSLKGNRTEDYQALVKSSTTTLDLTAACFDTALEMLAKELKKENNPYLILPGDLSYQGEYESHVEVAEKLEKWEKETGIDVIVINGNHDINNSKAVSFVNDKKESARATTQEEFRELYKNLGYDLAYHTYTPPKGKQQGGLSYSVRLKEGYRIILLDTNMYSADCTKDGTDEHETRQSISADLLKWALNECAEAKACGEEIIGVSHSSMLEHLGSYQEKIFNAFLIEEWEDAVSQLADAGWHFNFCGHQHNADVVSYVTDNGETFYECETPPTGTYPCGLYISEFTKNNGKVTAEYNYHDIDEDSPVVLYGKEQPQPFKYTAFGKAYGDGDITALAMNIIEYNLGSIFDDISESGGILEYLALSGIDLQALLEESFSGLSVGSIDIFTADNIMNLANDVCDQLYDTYLADTDDLYALMERVIDKVTQIELTETPCTSFIDTLGFGSKEHGGTLGDLVYCVLAYMFAGNGDISNDKFMTECLDLLENDTVIVENIFNTLIDVILDDLLLDEIFAKTDLNVDALFEFGDIGFILGKVVDGILTVILGGDKSLTNIVEFVFDLGILEWASVYDLVDDLLGEYITESQYESLSLEIASIVRGLIHNTNPYAKNGQSETCKYTGKVEVEATADNYRKPAIITVTYGEDSSSSYNISWYTKASVKGTDIEIVPYSKNPKFTGNASKSSNIKTTSSAVTRTFPGIDIGIFGLMTVEKKMTRHTVEITGLQAGAKYCYRIGDASRGWWSETGVLETADNSREVTFLHTTDCQSQSSKQYDVWANLLRQATKMYPDTDFVLSTGDLVDNGDNLKHWTWVTNNASDILMSKALMPTAGNHDIISGSTYALDTNFILSNVPEQDRETGIYYSFDYNNIHIAVLNANNLGEDEGFSEEQIEWLKEDMTSSDAEWKFVSTHKAIYSNGSHYDDDDVIAMREQLSVLMPELDIDMVFQGHDHVYLRTDSMVNNKVVSAEKEEITFDGRTYTASTDPEGPFYLIGGCSGVKYYLTKDASLTDKLFPRAESIVDCTLPVFSAITIKGNKLYFDAYMLDGSDAERIDNFAIVKTDLEEYTETAKSDYDPKNDKFFADLKTDSANVDTDVSSSVATGNEIPYVAFIVLPVAFAAVVVTYRKKRKSEQE